MEMQIIHELESASDKEDHEHYAVVSVLFKREETGHLAIDHLTNLGGEVDLMKDIFQKNHSFYYYKGS